MTWIVFPLRMSTNRPSVILGLDPGLRDTGYGIIRLLRGAEHVMAYGSLQTERRDDLPTRLDSLFKQCQALLAKTRPGIVVIEQLFFSKNAKTAMTVAHARGILLLCAQRANIPIIELSPLQLKQGIAGYGKADKKQIQTMVKQILHLEEIPKPDDAADALALAICGAHIARTQSFFPARP